MSAHANSRNSGPDRSVIVTVGFRKPLRIESPFAPPLLLRVASPSGSQNQAFDCDKGINFAQEIEDGCKTTYGVNYDDWPPKDGDRRVADIFCDEHGVGDLPPDSTINNPAPICVAVETGDKIGQFRQGLDKRFETPTCYRTTGRRTHHPPVADPRTRPRSREFFTKYDFANDPRYVTLVITDSGGSRRRATTRFRSSTSRVLHHRLGRGRNGEALPRQRPASVVREHLPKKPRQRRRLGALRQHRRLFIHGQRKG